jgi:hypothetical protein
MPVIETDNKTLRIENNILDNETVHGGYCILYRKTRLSTLLNKAGNAERSQMWSWLDSEVTIVIITTLFLPT